MPGEPWIGGWVWGFTFSCITFGESSLGEDVLDPRINVSSEEVAKYGDVSWWHISSNPMWDLPWWPHDLGSSLLRYGFPKSISPILETFLNIKPYLPSKLHLFPELVCVRLPLNGPEPWPQGIYRLYSTFSLDFRYSPPRSSILTPSALPGFNNLREGRNVNRMGDLA